MILIPFSTAAAETIMLNKLPTYNSKSDFYIKQNFGSFAFLPDESSWLGARFANKYVILEHRQNTSYKLPLKNSNSNWFVINHRIGPNNIGSHKKFFVAINIYYIFKNPSSLKYQVKLYRNNNWVFCNNRSVTLPGTDKEKDKDLYYVGGDCLSKDCIDKFFELHDDTKISASWFHAYFDKKVWHMCTNESYQSSWNNRSLLNLTRDKFDANVSLIKKIIGADSIGLMFKSMLIQFTPTGLMNSKYPLLFSTNSFDSDAILIETRSPNSSDLLGKYFIFNKK